MKNKLFLFLFFCCVNNLLAQESHEEHQFSLAKFQMDYREYDRYGKILDSEKSNFNDIAGVEYNYRYFLDKNSNIDFAILRVEGRSDYVGSYLNSNAGYGSVVETTSNVIEDISLGYNTTSVSNFNIVVLGGLGLGYRYWKRALSPVQVELYKWYSLRFNGGVRFVHKNLTASLIAEYQHGIKPIMTATGITEEFKLSSANIAKLSIPVRYMVNEKIDLICTYVFENQKILESNIVANRYTEPDSTARNQYLKAGVVFKY